MTTPSNYDRMRLAEFAATECKRNGVGTDMNTISLTIDALAAAGWLVTPVAALPVVESAVPHPGEFCHRHFSWLCQAGQGRCQTHKLTTTEEPRTDG